MVKRFEERREHRQEKRAKRSEVQMWRILNEKARHVFGLCVGRHTLVDTYVGIHTSGYAYQWVYILVDIWVHTSGYICGYTY